MDNIIRGLLIIILLMLLLSIKGCSTSTLPKAEPDIFYKLDLEIEWNKNRFKGYVVLPKRAAYELKFKSPGKMDLFTFKSCSREEAKEASEYQGSPKRAVIHYVPNEIERLGGCPVEIGAYEKIKGRHSWGFIDFEDDAATLPAQLICGGVKYAPNGVSMCQQRQGLLQLIRFQFVAIVKPSVGCEIESGNRGNEFIFNIKKGYCTYAFMELKKPHRIHRLSTYGYEKILLRSD